MLGVRLPAVTSLGFRIHFSFRCQLPTGILLVIGQRSVGAYAVVELYDGLAYVVYGNRGAAERTLLQTARIDDGTANHIKVSTLYTV